MGRKLFVGNLSFNTDERRLEELFASIGAVDSVNIVRDQMTVNGEFIWVRHISSICRSEP